MAKLTGNDEKFIGIIYNRSNNIYQEFRICDHEEFLQKVINFTIADKNIEGIITNAEVKVESISDPMSYFRSYDPVLKVKIEFTNSTDLSFMLSEHISVYYYFDIVTERDYVNRLL